MATQKTITINGRPYDAVTGLPLDNKGPSTTPKPTPVVPTRPVVPKPAPVASVPKSIAKPTLAPTPKAIAKSPSATRTQNAAATNIHGTVQKSKTLMRRATKKPVAPTKIVRRPQPGRRMDISRSASVAKFAPHPVVKEEATTPKTAKPLLTPDKAARVHPTAQRALAKAHAKKQATTQAAKPVTAKQVKDVAIAKAMATPKVKQKKAPTNKWVKRGLIIAISVLVLLFALFAVYKFVPSISVSVAAAQAGIEARYPDYTPDGYSLDQPVTYSDGEVNLNFKSNSNETLYAINQKRSSWDSSAVLDNVVTPLVGENYATTKERGLTIYTYAKGAAWANAGILYTITGDAALSGDQIRRIATSL